MRQVHGSGIAAVALALAAVGCGDTTAPCSGSACGPVGADGARQTSFESDLLDSQGGPTRGGAGGSSAVAAAPSTGNKGQAADSSSESAAGNAAARAISEADIIQVNGDRLYALSRISGLAVIDVSDPSALKLLGRYRDLPATPFEMYLQGDVALVMFSGWGQYVTQEDGSYKYVTTSKLLALDVADASKISVQGSFDLPGSISDSRVVGDILYIVSRQDGYCWSCVKNKQLTSITSLSVGNPRDVKKVDELDYDDGNASWGPRSVTVTSKRMYVSGPMYGASEPTESTIQVVDISDPKGDLVEGTSVQVTGQVQSRWQMDEYEGVLRVVSQPWQWSGTLQQISPAVQTFRVESSSKITALGRTNIQLPMRESLRSVRFDGPRGYAITAEQKDPLFTLDLSDPAKPRQVGELELPGFITHMEPRGERLLGLGFDQGNPEGSIAVSLFDVKDLDNPKLLSRVNFGGDWGQLPEDRDRLHKVFRVLPDSGMILVPFSGWSQNKAQDKNCGYQTYAGGVQLIDFQGDVLKARGATPSASETRRALLVHDKLLSVSDERVQAFDIANRDKPEQVSQVVLSRSTSAARLLDNDVVARLSSNYYVGDRTNVDLVSRSDATDPNKSLAELDVLKQILPSGPGCTPSVELMQTFSHGTQLEFLYQSWQYNPTLTSNESRQGLLIVDASNPAKPSIVSNTSWSNGNEGWYPYSGYYRYGYYGNASAVLRTKSTISLLESAWVSDANNTTSTQKNRLRVIDLRDPAHVSSTLVELTSSNDLQYSGLVADGDVVMTSHFERTSADGTRGRFYLDRFDLSNPAAPNRLAKVNVPGALMAFDVSGKRAITSEQVRTLVTNVNYEECYARFASAEWTNNEVSSGSSDAPIVSVKAAGAGGSASSDQPIPELPKGKCVGYKQRLHLVHLAASVATLEDTFSLEESQQVFSSSLGDGVLFATLGRGGYYYPRAGVAVDIACFDGCGVSSAPTQPTQLLVLGGFANGKFDIGHIKVNDSSQASNYWWGFWGTPNVYASGKRAILVGQTDVAVISAADAAHPSLDKRVPLISYAQGVDMHDHEALLALGSQGLQWIDLD